MILEGQPGMPKDLGYVHRDRLCPGIVDPRAYQWGFRGSPLDEKRRKAADEALSMGNNESVVVRAVYDRNWTRIVAYSVIRKGIDESYLTARELIRLAI